ncbi:MAG: DUF6356 family protein [Nitratireductor sp.]|nr:hypothetical protein [Nitratireductor sp.]
MTRIINRLFIEHPRSVDENYFEHFGFALRFSALLFAAAGAALVHALIPCLFEKTASKIIKRLHTRIANRGN